jgi:LacI family repressor for deo operon, udp, cdd, tsx, nupC, and nupG
MAEDVPAVDASPKRATIWEVARLAGVSHQTVSRYLRHDDGMRPDTRARVQKAIADLDYRPNLTARSMRTRRSNRIAIMLPALKTFAPLPVLNGAAAAAREAGYMTDVVSVEGDEAQRSESAMALLDSGQAEGILSFAPLAADPAVRRPNLAVFGEYDDDMHARGTLADGRPAEHIIRHLAGLGHRRFLHVAGSQDWVSARNRRAVYVDTIAALGLESYGVVDGDWSVRSGYEAARDLPANSGVTAVLAANDYVAMGVIRGFQDNGVRVPEDVSVFGWDNEQFTQYFRPTMSTVNIDRQAVGRQAMLALVALIRNDPRPQPVADSMFDIIPRGSSGPAPR